ncbi:flippase [soil metagenome]
MGTIQKQGLINALIIYFGVALGFFNQIVVQPHMLTTDEIGLWRVMINFAALLTTFLLLGASSTSIKYFASFRDQKSGHHGFLGLILLISCIGIFIGGCIFYSISDWIIHKYEAESPQFVDYFYWEFPLAVVMTLTICLNSYSSSLLKTTFPSFLDAVLVRIFLLSFTFIYFFKLISFNFFIASIFFSYLCQLLILCIFIYRIDKPSLRIDWSFFRKAGGSSIIRFSLLMALTGFSSVSLKFLDSVMIAAYLPLKLVGIYAVGAFIAVFIETPLNSLERIAGVKIAHGFEAKNMNEIKEIYYRSVRVLFLVGGFLAVCVITNIHDFLRLLPLDFMQVASVTIIISIGSIINMATGVNSPIIINSVYYKWNIVFLFVLLISTITLNLLLIPLYGMEGAAIGTGLASTVYNLIKFLFIWNKFGLQPYDIQSLKTLLVIILAFLSAFFIPVPVNPWMAMAERGLIIALVFSGLTYSLKIIPEYNHLLSGQFLRRKK